MSLFLTELCRYTINVADILCISMLDGSLNLLLSHLSSRYTQRPQVHDNQLPVVCLSLEQAVEDVDRLCSARDEETTSRSGEAEQRGSQWEKVPWLLGHGLWCQIRKTTSQALVEHQQAAENVTNRVYRLVLFLKDLRGHPLLPFVKRLVECFLVVYEEFEQL